VGEAKQIGAGGQCRARALQVDLMVSPYAICNFRTYISHISLSPPFYCDYKFIIHVITLLVRELGGLRDSPFFSL
jgi:hypothetical protein